MTGEITNCQVGARTEISRIFYRQPTTEGGLYAIMKFAKRHGGEKSNKCNQCDFASSQAGNLKPRYKTHSGEKSTSVACFMPHILAKCNEKQIKLAKIICFEHFPKTLE